MSRPGNTGNRNTMCIFTSIAVPQGQKHCRVYGTGLAERTACTNHTPVGSLHHNARPCPTLAVHMISQRKAVLPATGTLSPWHYCCNWDIQQSPVDPVRLQRSSGRGHPQVFSQQTHQQRDPRGPDVGLSTVVLSVFPDLWRHVPVYIVKRVKGWFRIWCVQSSFKCVFPYSMRFSSSWRFSFTTG